MPLQIVVAARPNRSNVLVTFPILVVPENGLPSVAAIHHVVNRPGIFHSELARHAPKAARPHQYVNIKN
jgi:hypothetical protein